MFIVTLSFSNESGDRWTETVKAEKRPTKKQLESYVKSVAGSDIEDDVCYLYAEEESIHIDKLKTITWPKKDPCPKVDFV